MTKTPEQELEEAKRVMGALVRMPPKPHEEMKLGKKKRAKRRSKKSATSR